MGRKVNVRITSGKPIIFDFNVEGEEIAYETICPNCGSKDFVISLDKTRITCNTVKCLSTLFLRRVMENIASDFDNITWNLEG